MTDDRSESIEAMKARIYAEMLDSFDEELEQELDDERLQALMDGFADRPDEDGIERSVYFKELFRLQKELVKLQDYVVASKLKVAVIFEGRDAAGKGGAIKRVTQRLNPRVCRVVALPAPSEREKTQWYFQRYVPHLPSGGQIVMFDRSWYNRAGVERVMGFCTDEEVEEFFRSVPEFERMLVRSGIKLILVFHFRRGAASALPDAHSRSPEAVEALADGPGVPPPLGAIHQGERGDDRTHSHRGSAVVDRKCQR
jgi:polyphosphate kinase 2 (PPK2 family)